MSWAGTARRLARLERSAPAVQSLEDIVWRRVFQRIRTYPEHPIPTATGELVRPFAFLMIFQAIVIAIEQNPHASDDEFIERVIAGGLLVPTGDPAGLSKPSKPDAVFLIVGGDEKAPAFRRNTRDEVMAVLETLNQWFDIEHAAIATNRGENRH